MIHLHEVAELIQDRLVDAFEDSEVFDGEIPEITRSWRPVREPKDVEDLQVTVVPVAQESTAGTRSKTREVFTVHILIQRRCPDRDSADTLDEFGGDIMRLFRLTVLTKDGKPVGYVPRAVRTNAFSTEHYDQHQVYTSIITVDVISEGTTE